MTLPGWPRSSYYMRVLGWYFLNNRHLTWKDYSCKVKRGKALVYKWRVNHTAGGPESCILSSLRLVPVEEDMEHYAENAKDLYGTVWRRPDKRSLPRT